MNEKDIIRASKFLSLVLRHKPDEIGITLDKNGWTNVEELIKKMDISLGLLEEVVATNNKKRFEFNEDKTRIRACQGHSVSIDLQLNPQQPPDTLYHGTQKRFVDSIFNSGLVKGNRNHVHLSEDTLTAEKVGNRRGSDLVVLKIDARAMYECGFTFFRSTNGVWLINHVPSQYIYQGATNETLKNKSY